MHLTGESSYKGGACTRQARQGAYCTRVRLNTHWLSRPPTSEHCGPTRRREGTSTKRSEGHTRAAPWKRRAEHARNKVSTSCQRPGCTSCTGSSKLPRHSMQARRPRRRKRLQDDGPTRRHASEGTRGGRAHENATTSHTPKPEANSLEKATAQCSTRTKT